MEKAVSSPASAPYLNPYHGCMGWKAGKADKNSLHCHKSLIASTPTYVEIVNSKKPYQGRVNFNGLQGRNKVAIINASRD